MKKSNYIHILLVIGMFALPTFGAFAQCSGPVDDTGTCCLFPGACGASCPTCTETPLDGGLSALLLAGVAFGAKKMKGKINL